MKILVTGSKGQLGKELAKKAPKDVNGTYFDIDDLDITDKKQVKNCLALVKPECIINASAYTAVDKAETDTESAFSVNEKGVLNLAETCNELGIRLIHISTDFVFSGQKNTPYSPTDICEPISVYGQSKLAGEKQIQNILGEKATIIRTSWLYSSHGNNFVKTMLKLFQNQDVTRVVYDQVGSPTWTGTLAEILWVFASKPLLVGVFHVSDLGTASWYDFAVAIAEEAFKLGIIQKLPELVPIVTSEYKTPAKRPVYSVLDTSKTWQLTGKNGIHWRAALRKMLEELKKFE